MVDRDDFAQFARIDDFDLDEIVVAKDRPHDDPLRHSAPLRRSGQHSGSDWRSVFEQDVVTRFDGLHAGFGSVFGY